MDTRVKLTVKSLMDNTISPDQISKTSYGTFIFRKTFYYKHGQTDTMFAGKVTAEIQKLGYDNVEIVDMGEVNKTFKGGASVKQSSHWWVELKIEEKK